MSESLFVDEEGIRYLLFASSSSDYSTKLAPLCIDSFDLLKPINHLKNIHNRNLFL